MLRGYISGRNLPVSNFVEYPQALRGTYQMATEKAFT